MNKRTIVISLLLAGLAACGSIQYLQAARRSRFEFGHGEVIVGAQVWAYSRVYPLLDGLLLDWLSNQINALTLSSSTANATSLDAIQQGLQLQAQYNQLAGVQNSANAQLTASNLAYQTNLAQQATTLLPQIVTAVTNVNQAQTTLNSLNASGASAADITAATAALTAANTTLTTLNSQLAALKSFPAPTPATPGTNLLSTSSPNLPGFNTSAIPTGVVGNATTVTANNGPSFPPTKQMDNQMNLLWERMARAVGVMVKPDSLKPNDDVYLVSFDTGIYPVERKKQLLDVSFSLNCDATVLGLYPRSAAININEDKYRDTSFGFGAVLNFFGIASTVAYNREHLRASQSLGESSYITGHGIGHTTFGWIFGVGLGDDSISPGVRTTFALVRAQPGCPDLAITLNSEIWQKPPHFETESDSLLPPPDELAANGVSDKHLREASQKAAKAHIRWPLPIASVATQCEKDCVKSIDFNRSEYAPGRAQVTITLQLNTEMDQQQTVTVNGVFIPRLRDSFGRASTAPSGTATAAAALEASGGNFATAAANEWILTSPLTMLLTLDASAFGNRFPQILLNSPANPPIDVLLQASGKDAKVRVSGRDLSCDQRGPAFTSQKFSCVPSLAFPQAALINVGVARWISTDGAVDLLSITPLPASSSTGVNSPTGVPAVQVVSDLDSAAWGPDAEVSWLDGNSVRPLQCARDYGTRLLCQAPDRGTTTRSPLSLQVIDANHPGGPVKALVSTQQCGAGSRDCAPPLLWKLTAPELVPSKSSGPDGKPDLTKTSWNVSFRVVNIDKSSTSTLATTGGAPLQGTVDCDESPQTPCTVSFTVPRSQLALIADSMILTVSRGNVRGRARIANLLSNMKPILGGISADYTSWYGQNLVYNQVLVGGTTTRVDCIAEGTSCAYAKSAVNVKNNPWDTTGGQMYFVASDSGLLFPFLQTNPSGPNTAVTLDTSKVWTPPKPPADQAKGKGTGPAPSALFLLPNTSVAAPLHLTNPAPTGMANLAPRLSAETAQ